jgi:mRNA interferase RelE/StbE
VSYRLKLHKDVDKFLNKCREKQREAVKEKLALLRENPRFNPQLDITALQGCDFYRLRIGQYRLIYEIKDDELLIFVMTMGNRGDVYKK